MRKQLILIAFIILVSGYKGYCAKPTMIKGMFENLKVENMQIDLYYAEDYYGISSLPLRGVKYSTKVKQGEFEFQIDQPKGPAYFMLVYGSQEEIQEAHREKKITYVFNRRSYLVLPGTEIKLIINDKKGVSFFGTESSLIECQYKMQEIAKSKLSSGESQSHYERAVMVKNQYDSLYKQQMNILGVYKKEMDTFCADVLSMDFLYDWKIMLLSMARPMLNTPEGYIEMNKAVVKFYDDFFLFDRFEEKASDSVKLFSRSYADFILKKEIRDIELLMQITTMLVTPNFGQFYDKINQRYKGALKEKVLSGLFLNYYDMSNADTHYIDAALSKFKTPEYHSIVEKIKLHKGKGQTAFDFNLQDSSGKKVSLNSLKGKFIILDFWFTGCGGCIILTEKMKPIMDYYRDKEEVVFVSISTDKNVQTWKASIKSGKYTHQNSLNLYTNGNGREEDIIKYYDIYTYPTLILIGKDGKIITSSPPKPITDEASRQFISLIDGYL